MNSLKKLESLLKWGQKRDSMWALLVNRQTSEVCEDVVEVMPGCYVKDEVLPLMVTAKKLVSQSLRSGPYVKLIGHWVKSINTRIYGLDGYLS